MPALYSIYDIIISETEKRPYYFGTFEDTEDPVIDWPHRHDYYSIIYFLHGSGINVIDFKEYEIMPNRIFMMNPGQIHNWSYENNTKGFILLFDKYYCHFENNKIPFVDVPKEYRYLIQSFFRHQISEYQKNDMLAEKSIISGIAFYNSVITRIIAEHNYTVNTIPPEMVNFISLITEKKTQNLSVQSYADMLHLTVDKLNETCKSSMGLTAKQIIIEQKTTEAKRLLYFTNLSIKEIAFRLGFEDSSYFSRIFKGKNDITPIMFREKVLENQKKVL